MNNSYEDAGPSASIGSGLNRYVHRAMGNPGESEGSSVGGAGEGGFDDVELVDVEDSSNESSGGEYERQDAMGGGEPPSGALERMQRDDGQGEPRESESAQSDSEALGQVMAFVEMALADDPAALPERARQVHTHYVQAKERLRNALAAAK